MYTRIYATQRININLGSLPPKFSLSHLYPSWTWSTPKLMKVKCLNNCSLDKLVVIRTFSPSTSSTMIRKAWLTPWTLRSHWKSGVRVTLSLRRDPVRGRTWVWRSSPGDYEQETEYTLRSLANRSTLLVQRRWDQSTCTKANLTLKNSIPIVTIYWTWS